MSNDNDMVVRQSSGMARTEESSVGALEPRNMQEGLTFAAIAAQTKLYGVSSKEDAFMRMATGMSLGLTAAQSLRGLFVISGKVGISADLMMALCLKRSTCSYFRCVESTNDVATFETQRGGDPPQSLTFTLADARAAGIAGDMYRKYPAAMLRARCIAALARMVYPEALHGLHAPEELRGEETAHAGHEEPEQPRKPSPAPSSSPSRPSVPDTSFEDAPAAPTYPEWAADIYTASSLRDAVSAAVALGVQASIEGHTDIIEQTLDHLRAAARAKRVGEDVVARVVVEWRNRVSKGIEAEKSKRERESRMEPSSEHQAAQGAA